MSKDTGASRKRDRAGHEQDPSVPALRVGIASAFATYSDMLPIPELGRRQRARFESNVLEDENGCWRWTGYRNHGRPYFKIGACRYFAQRVMFAETYGRKNLDSAMAIRTCGTRDCVNPDHIVLGGEIELAAERKRYGGYAPWGGRRAGASNPNIKFSDEQIEAIRNATGSLAEVAEMFGSSRGYVWRVRTGRSRAQAMSAGTAETQSGSGLQPASPVDEVHAPGIDELIHSSMAKDFEHRGPVPKEPQP